MGSESQTEIELIPSMGLIPRFLMDMFERLTGFGDFHVETSFLEVYGDDIYDLLDVSRTKLPLREDSKGGVTCSGLSTRDVTSATEAMQVLHEGTLNRSTAATNMNVTSSRSHAVFTVHLTLNNVCAKLTFVDLAGSERMKKTGAEGERAREGIQINMGLLALGNVINALADDEQMQNRGKKVHVPYRQSKLTRLLQDALGGNSQTLFLACVSPSDINANETLSTLHYANRARNIRNAPTQNIDDAAEHNNQWKAYASVLEAELISHKFGNADFDVAPNSGISDSLLQRNGASDYLRKLREIASDFSLNNEKKNPSFSSNDTDSTLQKHEIIRSVELDSALSAEVNPDEELAILDHFIELQRQERDFDQEQKKGDEELKQCEVALVGKEQLLLQIRDSLKVYHGIKAKYEGLVVVVQNLEREKIDLTEQLELSSNDPTLGRSGAIKKEIEVVERSLARARDEARKHHKIYRKAELEAQKIRTLELDIRELKNGRINLIQQQRVAAARYHEMRESKTREITALKRKDRDAERKLSKMETEIRIYKRSLYNRQTFCKKIMEQKKKTESQLINLLALRQREHRERTTNCIRGEPTAVLSELPASEQTIDVFSPQTDDVHSIIFLLENTVSDSILRSELHRQYVTQFLRYSDLIREMVHVVQMLEGASDEDRQELVKANCQLQLQIEIAEADVEKTRDQMALIVDDTDAAFESSTKQLISNISAPVLRTIIVDLMKKLADCKVSTISRIVSKFLPNVSLLFH
jgi:Kinesin motor domain